MGGNKHQIMRLSKTKDYIQPKRAKTMYGGGKTLNKLKIQKHSSGNIIKNIRNLFRLKKSNKRL